MTKKKPYHKENLRRDLLNAGRAYVEAHGHQDLSVRKLAQQVGVSPGAPYHHFHDRRALLLALAVDSFEELLAGMNKEEPNDGSPFERVKSNAMKFVSFALENPHMLELMYESELTRPQIDPQLQRYQELSHAAGAEDVLKTVQGVSVKEAGLRNMGLWTSIYGLVSMINKGIIRPFGDGTYTIPEITDFVISRAVQSAINP